VAVGVPALELPSGNYRVLYRLKVSDNSGTEPIAKLFVRAVRSGVERELSSRELRPYYFDEAGAWEVFELPVEIREDDEDIRIGVEFYGGVADLWCDWIRAVPAGVAIAGPLKVLGDVWGLGNLYLGDVRTKNTDTVLRLQSWVKHTRIEFREWRPQPQYGFDVEYDADNNVLIVRAQDGPKGPKEYFRIQRGTGITDIYRPGSSYEAFRTRVTGDSYPRFWLFPTGEMRWGPGNATYDVRLLRSGAGALLVDGRLIIKRSDVAYGLVLRKGTENKFIVKTDGSLVWPGETGTATLKCPDGSELVADVPLDVAGLRVNGVEVITPGRELRNVSADASIIKSGQFGPERIADEAITAEKIAQGVDVSDKGFVAKKALLADDSDKLDGLHASDLTLDKVLEHGNKTGKDVEWTTPEAGPVLVDRLTGDRYRLYVEEGTLKLEKL